MGRPIHEKINRLLAERGHKKKDLAKALGISPQTMTDITKGRSSVTLQHLKGLVRFFGLRADYWVDDERDDPTDADADGSLIAARAPGTVRSGIVRTPLPSDLQDKLRSFVQDHEDDWTKVHGPLRADEREVLGLREERRDKRGASRTPQERPGGGHALQGSPD